MEKKCNDCGEVKPLTEFYKRASSKDGYNYYCKPCNRARVRAWEQVNPERVKEYRERYSAGGRVVNPKKDLPKYRAVHMRLQAAYGKASNWDCVKCGGRARQWAYSNTCQEEIRGNHMGYDVGYCVHPEHYKPMCVPCHSAYDKACRAQSVTTN